MRAPLLFASKDGRPRIAGVMIGADAKSKGGDAALVSDADIHDWVAGVIANPDSTTSSLARGNIRTFGEDDGDFGGFEDEGGFEDDGAD